MNARIPSIGQAHVLRNIDAAAAANCQRRVEVHYVWERQAVGFLGHLEPISLGHGVLEIWERTHGSTVPTGMIITSFRLRYSSISGFIKAVDSAYASDGAESGPTLPLG